MKPALVEVEWVDACEEIGTECKVDDVAKKILLFNRISVGYLVLKARDRIVLARNCDPPQPSREHAEVSNFICIPRGWVKKITTKAKAKARA